MDNFPFVMILVGITCAWLDEQEAGKPIGQFSSLSPFSVYETVNASWGNSPEMISITVYLSLYNAKI